MLENIEAIISLGSAVVVFLATSITFLVKFIKAVKARNFAQAKNLLSGFVKEGIEAAEAIVSKTGTQLSGENKLAYALNQIKAMCAEAGIKFDTEETVAMIEETIATTKKVNSNNTICKNVNGVVVCEPVKKTEEVQSVKTPFQSF